MGYISDKRNTRHTRSRHRDTQVLCPCHTGLEHRRQQDCSAARRPAVMPAHVSAIRRTYDTDLILLLSAVCRVAPLRRLLRWPFASVPCSDPGSRKRPPRSQSVRHSRQSARAQPAAARDRNTITNATPHTRHRLTHGRNQPASQQVRQQCDWRSRTHPPINECMHASPFIHVFTSFIDPFHYPFRA